jgi:SAM-dependent methyltransferase
MSRNVEHWTRANSEFVAAAGAKRWSENEVSWGLWRTPEAEIGVLGDVSDLDVVELGCGTAYFSAWPARRGARVVGVDPTPAQLATAREMQPKFGPEFPLVEAFGEDVPCPMRRSTWPCRSTERRATARVLHVHDSRVGTEVARGGDLGGPQARLTSRSAHPCRSRNW